MTTTGRAIRVSSITGVYLQDLSPGDVLFITTRNSNYSLLYLGFGAAQISGNPKACEGSRVVT